MQEATNFLCHTLNLLVERVVCTLMVIRNLWCEIGKVVTGVSRAFVLPECVKYPTISFFVF
jgi:hypothetical protein